MSRSRSSSAESSSSEGELGGLFAAQDSDDDDEFVFEDLEVFRSSSHAKDSLPFAAPLRLPSSPSPCTLRGTRGHEDEWFAVLFHYSAPGGVRLTARLWLDGLRLPRLCGESESDREGEDERESEGVTRALFGAGLCALCWHYMHFAPRTVVVSETLSRRVSLSPQDQTFWAHTLQGVLAEFLYVNRGRVAFEEVRLRFAGTERETEKQRETERETDTETETASEREREGETNKALSQLSHTHTHAVGPHNAVSHPDHVLVPIGGGKDSLVVWHLAHTQLPLTTRRTLLYVCDGFFEFDAAPRLQDLVSLTNCEYLVLRHDFYDPEAARRGRSLLEACGHPWAALVLCDALLVALCLSHTERERARENEKETHIFSGVTEECVDPEVSVWLGYERSADEGNGVFINGREVNHQFDKSSFFLRDAAQFIRRAVSPIVSVSSPLDKMWELQIARIFCEAPELCKFHSVFLSCNEPLDGLPLSAGPRSECGPQWCLRCEKCAFVSLLLSAWLDADYLAKEVFPQRKLMLHMPTRPSEPSDHTALADNSSTRYYNACRETSVLSVFLSLFGGDGAAKPFDCVGTPEEARAALSLALWRYLRVVRRGESETTAALPEMLVALCEHAALPWRDSEHWLAMQSADDVLRVYAPEMLL